ncbi:FkbM family methyltransferase [Natrialba asiatica]|uniref:FkbM family methyltransferase n=1 Tax=Natrialba asiatica TaxID=64602 RepID=UPI0009FC3196|nr:FkbM family methyltransferase [Natrialba asiatica]
MGLSNWIKNTQSRFRSEPITKAVQTSLWDLVDGLWRRVQYVWLSRIGHHLNQGYSTTLAGEHVEFVTVDLTDITRAKTALGEERVLEWLMAGIDSDCVFWDIGAYRGTYSIVAAVKGATTIAFEPQADNMAIIRDNALLNGVTIDDREVALSDSTTSRQFYSHDRDSEFRIDSSGDQSIRTYRGDQVSPKPDVIKIDVEGHESAVLDGMDTVLPSIRRIVIEVHNDDEVRDIEERLTTAGLNVIEIPTDRPQTYVAAVNS